MKCGTFHTRKTCHKSNTPTLTRKRKPRQPFLHRVPVKRPRLGSGGGVKNDGDEVQAKAGAERNGHEIERGMKQRGCTAEKCESWDEG